MKPNDANNMRFLYYAEMYIISIMQLAEKMNFNNHYYTFALNNRAAE